MKISVNTLKFIAEKYGTADNLVLDGVDTLVDKIGAQLGGVEEVIDVGKKYDGVVIVKVVSCEDHPNADRLHVCMVDDGGVVENVPRNEQGLVQVVCGAPNVHAGVTVAWLPPGVTVPSTYDNDPFVLEARDLRGVVSNGMLASPKELVIGDSHEGLLIIDEDVKPGTLFADHYGLKNDVVIDIENKMFTHRPDCFGWLGVAREVAGIQGQKFSSPEWYSADAQLLDFNNSGLKIEFRNEIPELVPRFTALPIAGVTVGPSPVWLQVWLARVGLRPVNNIVDLTNYYMLLTGQPLHAYDYDKVRKLDGGDQATLVVRKPRSNGNGEKLTLLNGKEIEPRSEAILIATETQAIGLGGVMGGGNTEVDEDTKNIILECAAFDMYSIRRTSMESGIFSDAVTRFTKGQSPLQNMVVLAKITEDVLQICGGHVAGDIIDDNHLPSEVLERNALHPDVTVSADFINARLGATLSAAEMARLLSNVEFDVKTGDNSLTVRAPFWRTDIEIPEDIVEEVGRLYGYDKLPLELPMRSVSPAKKDGLLSLKTSIRNLLAAAGANEVLTYSFVHGNLLARTGQDQNHAYKLANALSPDLQYYRLSLTPSLLEKVHPNIKAGYDEFALFEMGRVHIVGENDAEGLPREDEMTALVVAASDKIDKSGSAYYQAKQYLEVLAGSDLTYRPVPESMRKFDVTKPFDMARTAFVYAGETFLGIIGEFRSSVTSNLKLPKYCAGFELDTRALTESVSDRNKYVPLPKYPKVEQDISLKVPSGTTYKQLYDAVWQKLQAAQPANVLSRLTPLDIFQRPDDVQHKNITFRFSIASYEKTLKAEEVNALLDQAAEAAGQAFGAERL